MHLYVAGTVDSALIRERSIIRDVLNGEALHVTHLQCPTPARHPMSM